MLRRKFKKFLVYLRKNRLRSFHKYPEHSRTTYLCIFDAFYENICLLMTKIRIKIIACFLFADNSSTGPIYRYLCNKSISLFQWTLVRRGYICFVIQLSRARVQTLINGGRFNNLESSSKSAWYTSNKLLPALKLTLRYKFMTLLSVNNSGKFCQLPFRFPKVFYNQISHLVFSTKVVDFKLPH